MRKIFWWTLILLVAVVVIVMIWNNRDQEEFGLEHQWAWMQQHAERLWLREGSATSDTWDDQDEIDTDHDTDSDTDMDSDSDTDTDTNADIDTDTDMIDPDDGSNNIVSTVDRSVFPDDAVRGVLTREQQEYVQDTQYPVFGRVSPDIFIVQLCSPRSSYCQEFYRTERDYAYLEQFPVDVALISRPYPLTRTTQEREILQKLLCRSRADEPQTWWEWYRNIMTTGTDDQDAFAQAVATAEECSGFTRGLEMTRQVRLLDDIWNITQIPTHIIINTATRQYILLPWFYEDNVVQEAIEELLWIK